MANARAGAFFVLLAVSSLSGSGQQLDLRWPRAEPDLSEELARHGEEADQDERLRDYFRRNGVVDPVRKRALVRAEYERWREEHRRAQTLSIGGSNWVNVGPTNFAGRIRAMAPHPATAGTLYAGSAGGGLWRTADSGATWTSLTDGVPDLAIGAVAVAASAPNTVYVGTGEGGIPGIGLMKTIDGGTNWTFPEVAAPFAGPYFSLSVNPTNANDVLLGTYQNGGQRSTDGGQHFTAWVVSGGTVGTWVRDIVRDPTNANTLWATTYGSSSTVIKSVDGGSNWTIFNTNLPAITQEIKLAVSSNGTTLYAAFDLAGAATVYKSVSGAAWGPTAPVSPSGLYFGQASYNNAVVVAPGTTDTVIVCGGVCSKSTSGGSAWAQPAMTGGAHVDFHDLEYDSAGTLYFATDGGIYTSADQGDHTTARNMGLITGQFYKIALDRSNPLRIVGGLQDNGTWRRNAAVTTWDNLVSSDGQGCILSNSNPLLGWASNQVYGRGNHLWRTNDVAAALGAALSPIPLFTIISPVFPSTESLPFGTDLVSDPQRLSILYTNTNRLWRSTTGGDTWVPLPITTTDASIWNGYVLTAIEIAPSDPKTIMVAKVFDVYRTTDGGTTWVRRNNGLPAFTSVNGLAIDPADSNTAYAALATSGGNNVYFTSDGGANWTQRSSGLPSFPAQVIRVDPTDSTTVYCGTAAGVYRSTNRGVSWTLFGTGLPKVAVYDLRIAEDGTLLRAGTHGRGVWELQIPPTGNNPPAVAITSPSSSTVAKGTVVAFSGTVSEPDADKITGAWTFPDTWDSSPVTATGATSVSHAFNTPGIWPVSLSARDLSGATASTSVKITVTEAGATCATALPIPAGPFPLTMSVNTETYAATDAAMTDPGDPTLSCYFGFRPLFTAWFTFTAPSSASYQFSTCGSTFYTVVGVLNGSCGATTEASGGCGAQADPNGVSCPNGGSIVTVALTAGQTVRVMAGGYYSFTGRGLLSLTVKPSTSTAPTVTRIAATAGPTTGGVPLTLYGSNFVSGMTATFGGTGATGVSVLTPNIATAIAPAHAAGAVDVAVINTDLQSGRLVTAYTYVTCAISLSPPSVSVASGGGIATASVTATPGCGWTAVSNASWIQTSSYGIGNGTLSYSVVANVATVGRSGTITVGDQTFTVNQGGVLPTNLVATATTTTSVTLTWTASTVNHFEVWRASGGAFSLIASPTAAGYTDNTPLANTTYVYKVRAVDGGAAFSAYSNNDIATTILFTDDPLVPFSTVIKAVHIARLRDAVNAVRTAAGLGAAPATDPSLTGVRVKAVHITELRAPLDLARSMLGVPALSYSSVVSGGTVKALAVTELRDGVK